MSTFLNSWLTLLELFKEATQRLFLYKGWKQVPQEAREERRQVKCTWLTKGTGKTGSKNVRLVLDYCCITSWKVMWRVSPPTDQTCLATNQVVARCEKLLQKVESSSTFWNKICTCCAFYRPKANLFCNKWRNPPCIARLPRNFIQWNVSIHATCNNLVCCKTGLNVLLKRATFLFNSFCSNVAKQVARFCCPFYRSLRKLRYCDVSIDAEHFSKYVMLQMGRKSWFEILCPLSEAVSNLFLLWKRVMIGIKYILFASNEFTSSWTNGFGTIIEAWTRLQTKNRAYL